MKRKFAPATLIFCLVTTLCFSQTRDYPKEIRGYKVERAAVELKPRESQKTAKASDKTATSRDNSSAVAAGTTSPAPTPVATPVADPNVDQLITFGAPSLARVTPLGITLNIPMVVAPIKQSGRRLSAFRRYDRQRTRNRDRGVSSRIQSADEETSDAA